MRGFRLLRPVAAAFLVSAGLAGTAAAGPAEDELWTCMAELLRQTPTWKAMRDARLEMQQKGFRVVSKSPESYPYRGRPIYSYGFQIGNEAKTYNVQCQDHQTQPRAEVAPEEPRRRRR